jgi:hypothetical protein
MGPIATTTMDMISTNTITEVTLIPRKPVATILAHVEVMLRGIKPYSTTKSAMK